MLCAELEYKPVLVLARSSASARVEAEVGDGLGWLSLRNGHERLDRSSAEYRRRTKASASRSEASPLLFATSAHEVLARSLLTIGSMQQSPRCLPRYRIHEGSRRLNTVGDG